LRNNNLLELKSALQEVEHRLKLFPGDIGLWIKKFEALRALGEPEKAAATLLVIDEIETDKGRKVHVLELLTEICTDQKLYELGYIGAKRLINLEPKSVRAQFYLGKFAYRRMLFLESIKYLEQASISAPENPSCKHFSGRSNMKIGRSDISLSLFSSNSNLGVSYSQIDVDNLFAHLYAADLSERTVFDAHQCTARLVSEGIIQNEFKDHPNGKRVGIVSGDFYSHSVSFFSENLIEGLLDGGFYVYCYSVHSASRSDSTKDKFKKIATSWSEMAAASIEELHQKIVDDSIDILFDLSGYSGEPKLAAFQRRSASVQISYIGYPHTTGISEMDYRIVDNYTDPIGLNEKFTTEKLVRLPDCFLCFSPHSEAPRVSDSRFEEHGNNSIRFGSFNNMAKITPKVILTWVAILNKLPAATLLIKAEPLGEDAFRERLLVDFEKHGVDRKRLILISWTDSQKAHLELFSKIDIHLDTFPYNGTTTTCEAAWQGVPTITFRGDSHRSRVGYSLMRAIGLESYVGETVEDYVNIAVEKASDFEDLANLRRSLRGEMEKSPLMDKKKYGTHISELVNQLMLP
jgi:predicted O-linked N-acetylglucosamine transferase (SPINDLY family)